MAATLAETARISIGESRALCFGTITFDATYPTGGEAIDAAGDFGYESVIFEGGAIQVQWDKTNQKAVAYWGNAGTASLAPEVTNGTDLSAQAVGYWAIAVK